MFGHKLTLFELFGFKVGIDASWLLLAGLITWSLAVGYFPFIAPGLAPATYWWLAVAGLIGLAFSIVAHELAHSLVARRHDMPIRGITLFIFGGVAEMEEEPTSPRGEFWMALAGPAMSFCLAALFYLLGGAAAGLLGGAEPLRHPVVVLTSFLAHINFMLAVFNIVPAFPLDGGRVLRSVLWYWRGDILWATRVAAGAGSMFGYLLMALGLVSAISGNLVGGVWWLVLGVFVRAAAGGQLAQQTSRALLSGRPVGRFMRTEIVAVDPELSLDRLIDEYFYHHYFKTFPVVADGRLLGQVSLEAVKAVPPERRGFERVRAVMVPCDEDNTVAPEEDAAKALQRMQRAGVSRLLVVRDGDLVGVLSLRDLLGFLSIKMDLTGGAGGAGPAEPSRR